MSRRQGRHEIQIHARLRVLPAADHEVVHKGRAALLNRQEDMKVVGQAAEGREAVDLARKLDKHPVRAEESFD